ncbi:MAG: hypothetical protein HUJ85_03660, partial [Veillonella sp.]|nr:hypothetical protein [Veillonella sp.]
MIDSLLASIAHLIGAQTIANIVDLDVQISFWMQNHLIMSWLTFVTYWASKITSSGLLWILIS